MKTFKKVCKIFGIILAIAGVIAGVYFAVTKFMERDNYIDSEENYVSCTCDDDQDFVGTSATQ